MSTYANIDAFVTKHLVLDLTADFDSKMLAGTAELRFERRDPRATEIVLDTRDLQIRKAEVASGNGSWADTAYRLDPHDGSVRQCAASHRSTGRRSRPHHVHLFAFGTRASVADAGADRGQEASVPVQPVAGDSRAVVHPAAGHARRALHLRRDDPRAEGARGGDGRGNERRARRAAACSASTCRSRSRRT